jgi:hypothetical protein
MLHYLNAEKWLFHATTVTCNQMKMDKVELDFHHHIELEEETPNLNFLDLLWQVAHLRPIELSHPPLAGGACNIPLTVQTHYLPLVEIKFFT